ncbi:hypothetical protein MMC29_000013 [Sticta canariensis]|nr:hypothetical protein [Sticta canariensis]
MGDHGPRLDHIILAARDVKEAAKHILEEYGLAAYEGGRHQGWGTENYIVPLNGNGYLEIAAVFDEAVAQRCDWGSSVLRACSHPDRHNPYVVSRVCFAQQLKLAGCRQSLSQVQSAANAKPWSLVTFCIETPEGALATAERLRAETAPMLRLRPDGSRLTWRVAAMSDFGKDRGPKPFFITWDDPSIRPDKVGTSTRSGSKGIA